MTLDVGRIGESLDVLMAVERRRVGVIDAMASILYDVAVQGEQLDQRIAAIGQALNGGSLQERDPQVRQPAPQAHIPSYPPPPSPYDHPAVTLPTPDPVYGSDPSYLYNAPPGFYEAARAAPMPTGAQQGPPPIPNYPPQDYRFRDVLDRAAIEQSAHGHSAPRYSGPMNGHNGGR